MENESDKINSSQGEVITIQGTTAGHTSLFTYPTRLACVATFVKKAALYQTTKLINIQKSACGRGPWSPEV